MFKEKYNEILLDHAHLYDGIKEQLDILKQKGIKIAVVTNKPHKSAVKMVETLFGKDYFDLITGSKDDTPRPSKLFKSSVAKPVKLFSSATVMLI